MAITIATVYNGRYTRSFSVIADADGDTDAVVPHGMGAIPEDVTLTPLNTDFYGSMWILGAITDTSVTITKGTAVGTGNAAPQVLVTVRLPHSIMG